MNKREDQINIRVDVETKRQLRELARQRNLSASDVVRQLINKSYARSKANA